MPELRPAQPPVKTIRDTVATPRLDAVLRRFSLSPVQVGGPMCPRIKVAVKHR